MHYKTSLFIVIHALLQFVTDHRVFYRRNRQIRGVLKNITLQMLFDSKHLETYLERKIAQFSSNAQVVENITQALDSAEGERVIEEELSSLYAQPEAHYLRVLGLGREQLRPLIKPSVLSLCAETAPMVLGAVSNGSSCRNDVSGGGGGAWQE